MTGIPDPDDRAWTAQAVRVEDFRCDTLFLISTCIPFCDEVTGHVIPGETALLPPPDLSVMGVNGVAASSLHGHEQELIRHYQRVVAAFASRGRSGQLRPRSNEFWLKPAVVAGGTVLTDCLWYDTVPDAEALLLALVGAAEAPDGEIWDDLDQGWRIRIVRSGDMTCIAEWNWEDGQARPSGHAFDSLRMARHAAAALARLRELHRHLVEALGRDWWS